MANKSVSAADLPVREGEDPWTDAELAEVRGELEEELVQHQSTITQAEAGLREFLDDEGGSGDAADIGSANFERDHEMTIAAHARDMLEQARLALEAIDHGTYGCCEECGDPIGKGRLQVYPRATLCMTCKQRQERR